MKQYKIYTPELKEPIDSKNLKGLSLLLRETHPAEEKELLGYFTEGRAKSILLEISPGDRTQLLGELPASVVKKLLNLLPVKERDRQS